MKKLFAFAVMAGVVLTPMMVRAEDMAGMKHDDAKVVVEGDVKAMEVGNKHCPVSGEEVGKMGPVVPYEHNGKIYNLCCPMCVKDFKKDPAKFAQKAEDEVAAAVATVPAAEVKK